MAVKTRANKTKTGVEVLITSPGYIVSPDKKYLEIRKFNLDLQVMVPTSNSAALMKCELACKAEAMACQKQIAAELDKLLKTVQDCHSKEAKGDKKAAEVADKEREKSLDRIQDSLADSRIAMRKSIAKQLSIQAKDIMTLGRGSFGDKAIKFPKDLFQGIKELEPDVKTAKSVDRLVEDAQDVAGGFDGLSSLRKGVVGGLETWHKEMETYYNEVIGKKKASSSDRGTAQAEDPKGPPRTALPPTPPEIMNNTSRHRRAVAQQVQDFGKAVKVQKADLVQLKASLDTVAKTIKKDMGLQENRDAKKALDEGLKKLKKACELLDRDLDGASKTVEGAEALVDEKSVNRWVGNRRGWISQAMSLDSTELLHAESVAKRISADLKSFSKTWKRAWS